MIDQADLKRQAGVAAAGYVQSGMRVGLGTGSTAEQAIRALAARIQAEGLDIISVTTSNRSEELARTLGIPTTTLDQMPQLDLTIDGADEIVLETFHIIKGAGGALLREKIVAAASWIEIIIVDETKIVPALGVKYPLPVEVVTFGWHSTAAALERLGAAWVLRSKTGTGDPFITDQGNYILDCRWAGTLPDPALLADSIKRIVGVVEHGLFIDLAHRAVIAGVGGVRVVERP